MNSKPNRWPLVLGYVALVHIPITALTWRDLRGRPTAGIRGSGTMWRVVSACNTAGSVAYWLWGRRPAAKL